VAVTGLLVGRSDEVGNTRCREGAAGKEKPLGGPLSTLVKMIVRAAGLLQLCAEEEGQE